jgi:Zn-dependent metalloprotease
MLYKHTTQKLYICDPQTQLNNFFTLPKNFTTCFFQARYKEHIQAIRSNNSTSKYTQHILESQHAYGPINDIMKILHFDKKGQVMNTWERYHKKNQQQIPWITTQ